MNFGWESVRDKHARYSKISPKKKMEWLREMNEFIVKCSTKKQMKQRRRLKEKNSLGCQ